MRSVLTVTNPASDLALLTIAEMREAAGVTGSEQDVKLTALGQRIAASITSECNIAIGNGGEPTLRQETLTETFYLDWEAELILARRHNIAISSIVSDAVAVDGSDYLVDPESGILTRLSDDIPIGWDAQKIVVVYQAGFATVPGDLQQAAMDFFRSAWLEQGRDPLVKSERTDIPGIMERETAYWVGSVPGQSSEGAVPDIVAGQLKRFRNPGHG